MAIKFFNKATEMGFTIAFVVPIQWRKYSVHKQLNKEFQLVGQMTLPPSSFYTDEQKNYRVNTQFQVWTKLEHHLQDRRIYEPLPTKHKDFDMWQYNATEQARSVFENDFDFAVLRQGYGDYNQRITDKSQLDLKKQWILFKAKTRKASEILDEIDFDTLSQYNTITPGFGKADVIQEYERVYENS